MRALAQLVGELSCRYWDLGLIPRSPIYCIIFVLTYSYAAFNQRFTMHAHAKAWQVASRSNLKAAGWGPWYTQSTIPHTSWKVKQALSWWAKIASKKPPKWARHPPWFAFFNFIFFSILILFNALIILFNSPKIIFII